MPLDAVAVLAAEDGPNPLLPVVPELIMGLVSFSLLFFFLLKKVWPVFEKTFAERAQAIEGGMERAEQAQAEADSARDQYNAQLAEARGEAGRIRTEAQAQRADIVEEARGEARVEAERILASAQAQIVSERQSAMAELRRDVGGLAVQLAGRIVGESLEEEARQRRTVERFLDELESASPGDAETPQVEPPTSAGSRAGAASSARISSSTGAGAGAASSTKVAPETGA